MQRCGLVVGSRVAQVARPLGAVRTFAEKVYFPNESDGNNYDLNWALNRDGVTPMGNAYRFKEVSGGKDGKDCAIAGADQFTFGEVGQTLTDSDTLYVYDGEVGTKRSDQIGIRLITDCEFLASKAMGSIMLKAPAKNALEFDHPITVYAKSGGEPYCAIEVADHDKDHPSLSTMFKLVKKNNDDKGTPAEFSKAVSEAAKDESIGAVGAVYSTGASLATIKEAIAQVASDILEKDVVYQKKALGAFDIMKLK